MPFLHRESGIDPLNAMDDYTLGDLHNSPRKTALFPWQVVLDYSNPTEGMTAMGHPTSKTGWWFGTFYYFPDIGNVIIPD